MSSDSTEGKGDRVNRRDAAERIVAGTLLAVAGVQSGIMGTLLTQKNEGEASQALVNERNSHAAELERLRAELQHEKLRINPVPRKDDSEKTKVQAKVLKDLVARIEEQERKINDLEEQLQRFKGVPAIPPQERDV